MNPLRRPLAFVGHYDGALLSVLWTVWLAGTVTAALAPRFPAGLVLLAWLPATVLVLFSAYRHRPADCERCGRRRARLNDRLGPARAARWHLLLAVHHRWLRALLLAAIIGVPVGAVCGLAASDVGVGVVTWGWTLFLAVTGLNWLHADLLPWCRRCELERMLMVAVAMPADLAAELLANARDRGVPIPFEFQWTDEQGQRWHYPAGGPAHRLPFPSLRSQREDLDPCPTRHRPRPHPHIR